MLSSELVAVHAVLGDDILLPAPARGVTHTADEIISRLLHLNPVTNAVRGGQRVSLIETAVLLGILEDSTRLNLRVRDVLQLEPIGTNGEAGDLLHLFPVRIDDAHRERTALASALNRCRLQSKKHQLRCNHKTRNRNTSHHTDPPNV